MDAAIYHWAPAKTFHKVSSTFQVVIKIFYNRKNKTQIEMTGIKAETSPQVYARIGGLAYLIIIVAGALGELFIRNKIIVSGDAMATASNIAVSSFLWCIGIAGAFVMQVCELVLAIVYY